MSDLCPFTHLPPYTKFRKPKTMYYIHATKRYCLKRKDTHFANVTDRMAKLHCSNRKTIKKFGIKFPYNIWRQRKTTPT